MKTLKANIFHEGKLQEAYISFSDKINKIDILGPGNTNLLLAVPGFIDLHVHGGGGCDIMEAGKSIETIASTHAKFGTTSFLATTMTSPFDELEKSFLAMRETFSKKDKNQARLLGVHLEGPFISSEKLGAQPNFTRAGTLKEITHLHKIVPIKIVTLAPEVFNHLDLIPELKKMGIIVQIGHTNGTYEQGVTALKQGAKSFTHLFNAMSAFHHRAPGMSGAALAHAQYAELIPDLHHVHPGAIKTALRCIPNLYFVTDSTAATGMPDGEYKLGSQKVHKCSSGVRLADGTLAGSSLTMDQAYRNLLTLDLSPVEISHKLSGIPAELISAANRGSIKVGNFTDLVLLDSENKISSVIIEGDECEF
ncbi:MAG: N-acetylglucosamine-6-phosphate deacetylase [Bacteriovorax sp.]|nr:N-acetylglucosamine-6-phosphate deacetylase [Bacteriovorax sp.]